MNKLICLLILCIWGGASVRNIRDICHSKEGMIWTIIAQIIYFIPVIYMIFYL